MRFGLFGTGPWAHFAHAPALAEHDDVEFVGVWGRNPDKAASLAGEYGVSAYGEIEALIADVDAVAVALPPDVQAPIALRAARAGKHLLLDKPVAFTAAEAGEIADAVAERGLASVVFFTRRLMPSAVQFVAEATATGGWLEARVDHLGSIIRPGNPLVTAGRTSRSPRRPGERLRNVGLEGRPSRHSTACPARPAEPKGGLSLIPFWF